MAIVHTTIPKTITENGVIRKRSPAWSVLKKHRFQIAPLWRAFSNDSLFGDRFRRCSVDDSRMRSKTAPFSFENGLVWTGPKSMNAKDYCD